MKAEIIVYCDSAQELHEFAQRILSRPTNMEVVLPSPRPEPIDVMFTDHTTALSDAQTTDTAADPVPVAEKKPRKPRSDAGQPRGPYNKSTGEPAASEPTAGSGNSVPASTVAAPATPTQPAVSVSSPAEGDKPQPSGQKAESPIAAAPTKADALAALKRYSEAFGPEKCIAYLQEHKVNQISKLPEAMFAEFIRVANERVAAKKA